MRRPPDPRLSALIHEWKATQNQMRAKLVFEPLKELPRFVAGADAAFSKDKGTIFAVALVYDRVKQRVVEVVRVKDKVVAPYIPGFLSFREGPAVIEALNRLKHPWGVVCCDGQGYAHPRRCGFATHVGVSLDRPAVGVAKSRFIGTHDEPEEAAGSSSPLMDKDEQIGLVLRTRDKTNPLFVSVGHRADLESARALVLACCTKYRVPEPTRQADAEVAKAKMEMGKDATEGD